MCHKKPQGLTVSAGISSNEWILLRQLLFIKMEDKK